MANIARGVLWTRKISQGECYGQYREGSVMSILFEESEKSNLFDLKNRKILH